jgi:subtilisin-like proprotein convertase family protein
MFRAWPAADNRRVRILFAIVFAAVALGAAPATASQGRLAVVHFDGPIQGRWYDALDASGVRIVWYQPQFAYLVHGTDAQLARAADGPGVRSLTPYTAADKVAGRPAGEVAVSVLTGREGAPARAAIGASERAVVTADGVSTRYATVSARELDAVARDPGVVAIAPAPEPRPDDERAGLILLGQTNSAFQPVLGDGYLEGLRRLRVGDSDPSFIVDVADTGLDVGALPITHFDFNELGHPQTPPRIAYMQDETGTGDARDCYDHGTHVASILAGYNSGIGSSPPETAVEDAQGFNYGLGVAPRVRIGVTRLYDCDGVQQQSRSFTQIASDRYARGARITNNSWGTGSSGFSSLYDEMAREYDAIVRDAQPSVPGNQQMVEVFSAGNGGRPFFSDGYYTVGSPGLAKNVIQVGASESVRSTGLPAPCGSDALADSARDVATFSSRGPTLDERIKPDVVAPGTQIVAATSHAGTRTLPCPTFPVGSERYRQASGTSMATPAVTGATALLREWYRRTRGNGTLAPSPAMTKALLVNTATDLAGGNEGRGSELNPPIPARSQGWGRINLSQLFDDGGRVLRDQSDVIHESGFVTNRTFTVADPSKPVKVTLAWSDAPGSLTSNDVWVNDLDLTVVKGGVSYRGNVFDAGISAAGGLPDRRNNLENVFLPPGGGTFGVLVEGFNIAGDGVPGNGDPTDQDYALVVSNALPVPESAVMPAEDDGITVVDGGDGDGIPEPGERVTLRVRAVNIGDGPAPATTAVLSGGDLAPIKTTGDYPALDVGAAAEQELVGRIPSGATCGTSARAVVEVRQPNRTPSVRTVDVPVGGDPSEVTESRAHAPRLTITDNAPAGVSSSIVVPPGERPIGEVKVRLDDLEHHYVGDLTLTLTGPNGRRVVLADEPGPGPGGSPANDLSGVVFDDAAANPLDAIPGTDTTVPPGSYRPDEPLGALRGGPASGTWTLTAIDKRAGVAGSLGRWSLITRRFGCSNPAAATTGPVTAVTPRSAKVVGTVHAGGVPTDYRVEYGTTAAYGAVSPATAAGDGVGARDVAATLTGLRAATTYHYRLVALREGAVVATGADRAFTTARAPTGAPPPRPRAFVSFAAKRITLRSRRFTLRFTGTPGTAGTLAVTGRRVNVTKPFRIGADGRAAVAVKLSRRAYRVVVRRKRLRVALTATVGAATFKHVLTLKPRKRRH